MDPKRDVTYLEGLAGKLASFIETFEKFMEHHEEGSGFGPAGLMPAASRKQDADEGEVRTLTFELHRLAGGLIDLASLTGTAVMVQGFPRPVDPFFNWETILRPKPLLEPTDVESCAHKAAGVLTNLIARAQVLSAPDLNSTRMHPLIWSAAQRLWNDGHHRQAVAAASEALNSHMKHLTGRNDAPDTSLWQQAFSKSDPQPGKPRLRWPGDPGDQDVKTMNDGLLQYSAGVNMVVRNTATHVQEEMLEQDGLERLAALSVLARCVDQCEVVRVEAGCAR